MFNQNKATHFALAALVAAAIPIVPALQSQAQSVTPAQNSLTMPESVASGTKVWIDGDPSLKSAAQSFGDGFEEQFPGTSINYESQGSDPAVTGVIAGRLDVAAIGRGLTPLEEKAGVETLSLPREKIATFVGVDNAFRGDISDQQFAQIFRGEITNWSELGGEDMPIRFMDLAATSDTRRSLGSYDLFEDAPFESGDTAVIQPNNISSVIENLGNDGIGYALFEQVKDRTDIRILPMHGVMPTDARYPFSQPQNFAYLGDNPSPEAIAFLGYVNDTAPDTAASNATASNAIGPSHWTLGRQVEAVNGDAGANSTVVNSTTTASADQDSNVIRYRPGIMDTIHAPWWLLLPLAALGTIGFAKFRRKRLDEEKAGTLSTATTPTADATPSTSIGKAGLTGAGLAGAGLAAGGLRNRQKAKGRWKRDGLTNGVANGRIANDDAAGFAINNAKDQTPHRTKLQKSDLESRTVPQGPDLRDNKPITPLKPNQPLQRPVKKAFDGKAIPTNQPISGAKPSKPAPPKLKSKGKVHPIRPQAEVGKADLSKADLGKKAGQKSGLGKVAGAGLAAAGLTGMAASKANGPAADSTPTGDSTPSKGKAAKPAEVEVSKSAEETAPLVAKATNSDSNMTGAPMAGVGNSNNDQTWITLTSLNSHQGEVNWHVSEEHRLQAKRKGGQRMMIRIHDADHLNRHEAEPWLASSYTYECRHGIDRKLVDLPEPDRDYVAEVGFLTAEEDWIHIARSVHSHSPTPEYDGCRIVIMPCDPHRQMREEPGRNPKPQAYVYWDIAPEYKRRMRKQGGQMLALRIYDADHIDLDHQHAHHTDEYMLDENARDKVVAVPIAAHDYVAEIGYLTIDGEFLSIGRSVHANIPVTAS